jgi:hypothetical protein
MSEGTVSAKDKKKDKTDRDKRSHSRSDPDKEKEDLARAIRKSQKADRKRAKEKEKGERELAEVFLEKSRLEAERGARASSPLLQTYHSRPSFGSWETKAFCE